MSSYKRIPKSLVKHSSKPISINDRYSGVSENYLEAVEKEEMDNIFSNLKEKESEMINELENRKSELEQQGYERGFERAKLEVRKELDFEYQNILKEAQVIYDEANSHRQKMYEESQKAMDQYMLEKKDEVIEVMIRFSENLIHGHINENPEKVETIFQQALENVLYETKKIFVRTNPKTREWFMKNKPPSFTNQIELLSDVTLNKADFIIETEREFIDATMDSRLQEFKNFLRGAIND
jgi:flagellar assembly protein FliH